MTDKISIKTAVKGDSKLVEALAKEIWTQHYLSIIGIDQIDYMLDKFQSELAISNDIECGYTYFIAYFDDIPCGYSSIRDDKGVFLSKFYVKKAYRGKGIGKAMISTIEAYAIEHSAHRIWLTCNKHNSASLGIYEKLGFKTIDSIVTDIGSGFVMDDYVLEKDLTE